MKSFPEFILASRSPRRRQLLQQAGYRFRVLAPPLVEPPTVPPAATPAQLAEALAYFKARSVHDDRPDRTVLAADTVVSSGGRIFGKADDEADARRILEAISRARHAVTTGLALLLPGAQPGPQGRFLASETSYVTMRRLSEQQLREYLASGEWRDKAGAYAIQESGDAFVEKLEGSFTNVVGLPMELLERLLAAAQRFLCGSA